MLDPTTFNSFIGKANQAYQQFELWFHTNNEFVKHQARWNILDDDIDKFVINQFTRRHGCRYKNFWSVTIASLQHGWILGIARIFDPAYSVFDKLKNKPRLSLEYILSQLNNEDFGQQIRDEQKQYEIVVGSLKDLRNNIYAHNDLKYSNNIIEAGAEQLFNWLESVISRIKELDVGLKNCNTINIDYNLILAKTGVEEIFEDLVFAENNKNGTIK